MVLTKVSFAQHGVDSIFCTVQFDNGSVYVWAPAIFGMIRQTYYVSEIIQNETYAGGLFNVGTFPTGDTIVAHSVTVDYFEKSVQFNGVRYGDGFGTKKKIQRNLPDWF
jgi:hypothetical protein